MLFLKQDYILRLFINFYSGLFLLFQLQGRFRFAPKKCYSIYGPASDSLAHDLFGAFRLVVDQREMLHNNGSKMIGNFKDRLNSPSS